MYGYVYKSYCIETNKYYIGSKKSNKIIVNYFGSGKNIVKDIEKYGKDSFVLEIIEKCSSKEELSEREMFWIDYYDAVNSDSFYNMFRTSNRNDGLKHSDSSKKAMSEKAKRKMSDETKKKISNTMIYLHKCGVKFAHDSHNRNITEETRKRWAESCRRTHTGNKYFLGKHHTEETKKKISNSHLGKIASDELRKKYSEQRKGKIYVTNGVKNRIINPDQLNEFVSLGYHKGRTGSPNKGNSKIFVNKNGKNKQILPELLNEYLKNGWNKGLTRIKSR